MRVVLYTGASFDAGTGKGAYAYWIDLPGRAIRKSGILAKIKSLENVEWQALLNGLLDLLDTPGGAATDLVIYANVKKEQLRGMEAGTLPGICRALLTRFKREPSGSAWEVRDKTGEEGKNIQEWCDNTAKGLISAPDC